MRKILLFISVSFILQLSYAQQAGIGTNTPAPSARLEIKDSAKGILIPRMTNSNRLAINNPAEGLLIYQTDNKKGIWRYTAGVWKNDAPPLGNNTGDLLYWNGTDWVILPAGNYGKPLGLCEGIPTWGGCLPSITTRIYDISRLDATADVGFDLALTGGTPITRTGVCWSKSPNPTIDSSFFTKDGPLIGNYVTTINKLAGNTTYHIRAYATNSVGTVYGQDIAFTTKKHFGGQYTSNGYFYHPSAPRAITDRPKTLEALSENSVKVELGDLASAGYFAIFTVDTLTNNVTISQYPSSVNVVSFGAGLPTTNPGYTPQWSGSANCNNVYDPVNKEFRVRYGYMGGTGYRVTEEIIKLNQ